MPATSRKRSLRLRLKVAAVSLLGLLFPSACTPPVTCYVPPAPTDPPTPYVTCYEAVAPTDEPASPLPTPASPLSPLPTPTQEARSSLRGKLLAGGRLPESVARKLQG